MGEAQVVVGRAVTENRGFHKEGVRNVTTSERRILVLSVVCAMLGLGAGIFAITQGESPWMPLCGFLLGWCIPWALYGCARCIRRVVESIKQLRVRGLLAIATLTALASLIVSIVALSKARHAVEFSCLCSDGLTQCESDIDDLRLEIEELKSEALSRELQIDQLDSKVFSHGLEIAHLQADGDDLREQIRRIGLIILKMMSGQR